MCRAYLYHTTLLGAFKHFAYRDVTIMVTSSDKNCYPGKLDEKCVNAYFKQQNFYVLLLLLYIL